MARTEPPPGINQLASQTRLDASTRVPGKPLKDPGLLHAFEVGKRALSPAFSRAHHTGSRLFAQEHLQDMQYS